MSRFELVIVREQVCNIETVVFPSYQCILYRNEGRMGQQGRRLWHFIVATMCLLFSEINQKFNVKVAWHSPHMLTTMVNGQASCIILGQPTHGEGISICYNFLKVCHDFSLVARCKVYFPILSNVFCLPVNLSFHPYSQLFNRNNIYSGSCKI